MNAEQISGRAITRRDAGRALAGAAVAGLVAPSGLAAQSSRSAPQGRLGKLLVAGRERDWTFRGEVTIRAFQDVKREHQIMTAFNFDTVAAIFPVPGPLSSTFVYDDEITGKITFDGRDVDEKPEFISGYPAGARFAKWTAKDVRARTMRLRVDVPMTCWRTTFDEHRGKQVPWPEGEWGPTGKSAFGRQIRVDYKHPEVQKLVNAWTDGKDPKSIPPVTLAKWFMGRALEHVRLSGNGLEFEDTGRFSGVALKSAAVTAKEAKGSPHDLPVLLAAAYLAAGLPARTVIGWDVSAKKDPGETFLRGDRDKGDLRTWVEFCLYDESTKEELWVPVDPVAQRGQSSRAPDLNRKWKYFGTHEDLDTVCPFALQFHPPTSVVSHGDDQSLGFWGWAPTPRPPAASQALQLSAMTTPKTRDLIRKRERQRREQG